MSTNFNTSKNTYGGNGRFLICEVVNVKDDTEQSGRVQCRVIGYQGDEAHIPQETLRWARVEYPPTMAMKDGVGGPGVGLKVGSIVYGRWTGHQNQELSITSVMAGPAAKSDNGGDDKKMSDLPPQTRTNNDEYGLAGDKRLLSDGSFDDKSLPKYGESESPNAFGLTSSKQSEGWSMGTYQYKEV